MTLGVKMQTRRFLLKNLLAGFAGLTLPSIAWERPDYFAKQIDLSKPSQLMYYGFIKWPMARWRKDPSFCSLSYNVESDSRQDIVNFLGIRSRFVPGKFIGWMPKPDGTPSIIPIFLEEKVNEKDIPKKLMEIIKTQAVVWDGQTPVLMPLRV